MWQFFAIIRQKLCSGESGYTQTWGPIDTTLLTCECGKIPLFPDNVCIDADFKTGCEQIECPNGLKPTYDGRCLSNLENGSGAALGWASRTCLQPDWSCTMPAPNTDPGHACVT